MAKKISVQGINDLEITEEFERIQLIATVIGKQKETSFETIKVDDGTGNIEIRNFNSGDAEIGDVVNIVGRVNEYMGNKQVVGDVIKKINPKWLEVRRKELGDMPEIKQEVKIEEVKEEEVKLEEEKIEDEAAEEDNIINKTLKLIKEMDKGQGADAQEISEKIGDDTLIEKLLRQGEIFEIKPGKVKVLD